MFTAWAADTSDVRTMVYRAVSGWHSLTPRFMSSDNVCISYCGNVRAFPSSSHMSDVGCRYHLTTNSGVPQSPQMKRPSLLSISSFKGIQGFVIKALSLPYAAIFNFSTCVLVRRRWLACTGRRQLRSHSLTADHEKIKARPMFTTGIGFGQRRRHFSLTHPSV